MKTQLTLNIDASIISKAKLYAKQTDRSLSAIVQSYLETLTEQHQEQGQLSVKLGRIAGTVKLPVEFNEHAELKKYLEYKHLSNLNPNY